MCLCVCIARVSCCLSHGELICAQNFFVHFSSLVVREDQVNSNNIVFTVCLFVFFFLLRTMHQMMWRNNEQQGLDVCEQIVLRQRALVLVLLPASQVSRCSLSVRNKIWIDRSNTDVCKSGCDVHNDDELNALLHDYERWPVRICIRYSVFSLIFCKNNNVGVCVS